MKKFTSLLLLSALLCSYSFSQRILLSQNFETGPYTSDSIPVGWVKFKVNGPGMCTTPPIPDWRIRDSGKVFCATNSLPDFTTKAYMSLKSLSIPWTATTGSITDDWVFTNSLTIATGDSLKFRIQLGTWSGGTGTHYSDSLQIWITSVASPTGGTRTRISTVLSLPQGSNYWQFKTFDLSAFNGQTVYVGFRYNMNVSVNGIMANLDDVFVGNLSGPPVGINNNSGTPHAFDLKQNYPNPFNPTTMISYDIPKDEFVNLTIYNSIGQEIAVLVNNNIEAGSHSVTFDATNLPSGVYLYRITAGSYTKSMKMSLIK